MSELSHTRCPLCLIRVRENTLARYAGVCRRCRRQPLGYRLQWIVFGLLAISAPFAAFFVDQQIAQLQATGGSERVNVLIAIAWRIAGRPGVIVFFLLIGCFCMVLCVRSWRSWRTAQARLAAAASANSEGELESSNG